MYLCVRGSAVRVLSMYTVAETNLQQYVEIVGGVLPGIIAGALGFQSNGGCDCGCGVACDAKFTRWVCPGDIGYACSSEVRAVANDHHFASV
jgi:hypothetical protein